MDKPIKIIIIEKNELLREGIRSCLKEFLSFQLVGEAGNVREALKLLKRIPVDIILLDVEMPRMNSREVMHKVARYYSDTKVIVMNVPDKQEIQLDWIREGARAYLPKIFTKDELIEKVQTVHQKGICIHDEISSRLKQKGKQTRQKFQGYVITPREEEILRELDQDKTEAEIAEKLGISIHTVHKHKNNMRSKTGTHTTSKLLKFVAKSGFLD